MCEVKWVPWVPSVGDIKPERYQLRLKDNCDSCWEYGRYPGELVTKGGLIDFEYRVPDTSNKSSLVLDVHLPYLETKIKALSDDVRAEFITLKSEFAEKVQRLIERDM